MGRSIAVQSKPLTGMLSRRVKAPKRSRTWPVFLRGSILYDFISILLLVPVSYEMLKPVHRIGDLMYTSGVLATIAALLVAAFTDGSTVKLLSTMRESGLVQSIQSLSDVGKVQLCDNIRWHVISVVVLTGAGILYVAIETRDWPFSAAGFFGYVLTGSRFGRIAANGVFGDRLIERGARLDVRLCHRDDTGGLAFVGDFFVRQVSSLVIPVTWLVFWLISMATKQFYYDKYFKWWPLFLLLLIVVGAVFYLGVVRPMLSFRCMMEGWKSENAAPEQMSARDYKYEMALLPKVPISPDAIRTSLLGVIMPMALATASAIVVP